MIDGIDELNRKLGELADYTISENLEKAVRNQTKMVQAQAKLMCPVNDGELRNSIKTAFEKKQDCITGICYTNNKYASYVEFGTGPKGSVNHSGISPAISPAYTQKPWWIHESEIDAETAEKYHWFKLETREGVFYQCTGQPAQPFMYPGLKNNEKSCVNSMGKYLSRKIREEVRK